MSEPEELRDVGFLGGFMKVGTRIGTAGTLAVT
jgi:hypothetical protein